MSDNAAASWEPLLSHSAGKRGRAPAGQSRRSCAVTTCQICVSGRSAGCHAGNTMGHGGASLGMSQATHEQPDKVPNERWGPRSMPFSSLRLGARGWPHPAPTAHCPRALLSRLESSGTVEPRVSASASPTQGNCWPPVAQQPRYPVSQALQPLLAAWPTRRRPRTVAWALWSPEEGPPGTIRWRFILVWFCLSDYCWYENFFLYSGSESFLNWICGASILSRLSDKLFICPSDISRYFNVNAFQLLFFLL